MNEQARSQDDPAGYGEPVENAEQAARDEDRREREHEYANEPARRAALIDSWREVGDLLRELGNRLAAAFRVAWSEERGAEQPQASAEADTVSRLRDELRVTADRLDRVARRVAGETTQERSAAFQATRKASEESLTELGNVTVEALRNLNRQLGQFLAHGEQHHDGQQNGTEGPQ